MGRQRQEAVDRTIFVRSDRLGEGVRLKPRSNSRCPRCAIHLTPIEHQGSAPEVCPRCHGLFLHGADLKRHFGPAVETLAATKPAWAPYADHLPCPSGCGDMRPRSLTDALTPVVIDLCPFCRGVWFDGGEVDAVFRAARRAAASAPPRTPRSKQRIDPFEEARERLRRAELEQTTGEDDVHARTSAGWWLLQFVTQIPLEGVNPVYRFPIVTWVLMIACLVAFGAEIRDAEGVVGAFGLVPKTVATGQEVAQRLFGSMFLHAGLLHLLGNLYFLKIFGDNVEDRLGRLWYITFYVCCGLLAGVAHAVSDPSSAVPMIGASGAISGVLGGYLVFFPDARITVAPQPLTLFRRIHLRALHYLPIWFAWQFISLWLGGETVAYWAHIGGFVAGWVLAWAGGRWIPDARVEALARSIETARSPE